MSIIKKIIIVLQTVIFQRYQKQEYVETTK